MKTAIVHDFLNQRGGAERVVVSLSRLFPDAPIFTSMFTPDQTHPEFSQADVRTSFMQSIPGRDRIFRALLALYPVAFKRFDLDEFDLVISSTTHWGHHARADRGFHVVYCHHPPRWLYKTKQYLTEGGPAPGWARGPLAPLLAVLRRADLAAAARADLYLANSRVTADAVKELYGRDAKVVHPPINTARFANTSSAVHPEKKGGDESKHYLVVSRLLPYKRVDLAVEVCSQRGAPLVVVGEGPARSTLESKAGPTVRFAGKVPDEELVQLYSGARALIQCGSEDFGMVPLEANAAGIPSVALRNGGALETVIPGETGILFSEPGGDELSAALDRVEAQTWDAEVLRAHAARFDERSFHLRFMQAIIDSIEVSG